MKQCFNCRVSEMDWVGSGKKFPWVGLGAKIMDWVALGFKKATNLQLWRASLVLSLFPSLVSDTGLAVFLLKRDVILQSTISFSLEHVSSLLSLMTASLSVTDECLFCVGHNLWLSNKIWKQALCIIVLVLLFTFLLREWIVCLPASSTH